MDAGQVSMVRVDDSSIDPRQEANLRASAEADADPMTFRFSITWSMLSVPLSAPRVTSITPITPAVTERPRPISNPPKVEPQPAPSPASTSAPLAITGDAKSKRSGGASFQWEMVVPRMVRGKRLGGPGSRFGGAAREQKVPDNVPNLYTTSGSFWKSASFKLCAAVVVAAGIAVPVWRHASQSDPDTVESSITGGDWTRQAAVTGNPGVKRSRQLILYRPAMKARDARLQFDWAVGDTGVGWVFRAKDLGNYYAMQLKVVRPGASPAFGLEHFTVYNWAESVHTEKVFILSSNDRMVHVRMDIFGPMFTLYLQDKAIEYWTDARLASGALGFLEEWNQGADVRSVRLSLPERSAVTPLLLAPDRLKVVVRNPGKNPTRGA